MGGRLLAIVGVAVWGWSAIAGEPSARPPGATTTPTTRPVPVVVELFTSEGCSDCPPAERVLADLVKAGAVDGADVVGLAMHVDYFNNPWKDPFSSPKFTHRQEIYAATLAGAGVYTPQMIVDGVNQFPGGNRERAIAAVREAAGRGQKGEVTLKVPEPKAGDKTLTAVVSLGALPAVTPTDVAEVWVAVTEDDVTSAVAAGENKGKRLAHVAVVREWQLAGRIPLDRPTAFDRTGELPLNPDWKRDNLRVVVMVQERASRRVLALATARVGGAGGAKR